MNKELCGFIDVNKILQYLSQEDIYEICLGYKPTQGLKILSPYRIDNKASCFFMYNMDNKLVLVDYAAKSKDYKFTDCFDLVKHTFKLNNFYQVLNYLRNYIIDNKVNKKEFTDRKIHKKEEKIVKYEVRDFNLKDKKFWTPYKISKNDLLNDSVYPIHSVSIDGNKKYLNDICSYVIYDIDNHVKIYSPHDTKFKFIGNCTKNNIGNLSNITYGEQLIISKSYKDSRVLRNLNQNDVVWFQNEVNFPDDSLLYDLTLRFNEIVIFFDNDYTGMKNSENLKNKFKELNYDNVRTVSIYPKLLEKKVKDPSDFIKKYGEESLKEFLIKNNLNNEGNKEPF